MSNKVLKLMVWLDAPPVANKATTVRIGHNAPFNIADTHATISRHTLHLPESLDWQYSVLWSKTSMDHAKFIALG